MTPARAQKQAIPLAARYRAGLEWFVPAGLVLVPLTLGRLNVLPGLFACALTCSVLALGLWVKAVELPQSRASRALLALLALFVAWHWVGLATSACRYNTLAASLQATTLVALVWLALSVASRPGALQGLVWALVAGAVLAALWGLREYLLTLHSGEFTSWRTFSTFDNPNLFAGYLAVGIACTLGLLRQQQAKRGAKVLAGLALLVMLPALFTTASRGGVLAALGAWLAFALVRASANRKLLVPLTAGVLGLILLGAGLFAVLPGPRQAVKKSLEARSYSTAFRLYTWEGTLKMIAARPVLGFGAGTFAQVFPRYMVAGYTRMAHEDYLQFAAELGLPGAALWVAFLLLALVVAWRTTLASKGDNALKAGIFAALVAAGLHSLVDYDMHVMAGLTACVVLAALAVVPSGGQVTLEAARKPTYLGMIAGFLLLVAAGGAYYLALAEQEYQLGINLMRAGEVASAEGHLQTAVERVAFNPEYQLALGEYAFGKGRSSGSSYLIQAGLEHLHKACWSAPLAAKYPYRLGRALAALGRTREALEALDRALELDPHSLKALNLKAHLSRLAGHEEEALKVYSQVLALRNTPFGRVRALEYGEPLEYAIAAFFEAKHAIERHDYRTAEAQLAIADEVLQANKQVPQTIREAQQLGGLASPEAQRKQQALEALCELLRSRLLEAEGQADQAAQAAAKGKALLQEAGLEVAAAEALL